MRFLRLKPYGELELVSGKPAGDPGICPMCGRRKAIGETELTVRFLDPPPYPDALGVLYGQEWLISEKMRAVIDANMDCSPRYSDVCNENGEVLSFCQVLLDKVVFAGRESILGGEQCEACGGYVQLSLDPLFLKQPTDDWPKLARLFESPGVIVVRDDLGLAFKNAGLDVEMTPVFFETVPGETF